ncbi:hypothetical protein FPD06_11365, partial [Salmonella enterica]|nr:hypothetical protein [Salmonella enterica]
MNTKVRDDVIGLDGSVDYKETSRAPYTKVTAKVPKNFPVDKITSSDVMTITSELANGQVADLYKHLRFCDQNVGRYCC